jgi:integrase
MTPTKKRRGGRRDGLFQRNGWWWIDYYDATGRRHRKKAAPDYVTAKLVYRDLMGSIARGDVLGTKDEGMTVATFAEKVWWPRVEPRLAPVWAERVKMWILDAVLLPVFGSTKLVALKPEAVQAWAADRIARVSASTYNKEVWVLKNITKSAAAWGYIKTDPAAQLRRMTESRGRVRYLSDDERDQLLAEANPDLRLFILFALHTGARRSELLRLTWSDIDFKAGLVRFVDTKNRDSRSVPMTATLRETVAEQLKLAHAAASPVDPDRPVLPPREPLVLTRAFSRLAQRLEIKNLTFHDLRHDAASRLAMDGVPLRTIAAILGHRDIRMTSRYAHLSPQHLRDAMRALDNPTTEGDAVMTAKQSTSRGVRNDER